MLSRNCEIEKLLEEGDCNVLVTIYNPICSYDTPRQQKEAWINVIKGVLGEGITNSSLLYSLSIKTMNKVLLNNGFVSGYEITRTILQLCENPQPIRITLKGSVAFTNKVWIIV